MSGIKQSIGSAKARQGRKVKVAPMTQAVRRALAASAMAFALSVGSGAMAANHAAATPRHAAMVHQAGYEAFAPVADLTTVAMLAPGDMEHVPVELHPTLISEYGAGDIVIDNADPISETDLKYDVVAISGYSTGGDVSITNQSTGYLYAGSLGGDAIGIYGYALDGSVTINNAGDVVAFSGSGIADGIFASGANVEVSNSGELYVVGATWAAGIEAQGEYSTGVENSGDIYAASAGGQAFGIYATGAEVTVGNEGDIEAQGYYATGIEVQSSGDVLVTNSGDITAGSLTYYYNPYTYTGYLYGSALANGINATSNGEGAAVGVSNSGDISAVSYFGGAGISATSGGQGGTASVTNSGNIYSSQYTKYGYGAYGIVTSADGDSSIDNSGGIEVVSAGAASGVAALSFAGDAHVTNSGDISTYSSAALYYNSVGITAFAANGDAHVENSGSVDAGAKYWASGVDARAYGDVTVSNSGSLYADGQKYAFGVYASAAGGDVMVHNEDGGEIGFYSYLGRGWGVFGYAGQGDVHVDNDGTIAGYAYGQSAGVFGIAGAGNVSVDNSGTIDVVSGGNVAVGVFARADYGTASVTNSGDITASNFGGYYTGYSAYGVFARGAYAEVANSGSITAEGYYYATGIAARSYYGTTITTSATSDIEAYSLLVSIGIEGRSEYGNVVISSAGDIGVEGALGGGIGIQAYSGLGNVAVTNAGDIAASSEYGTAIGITGYSVAGNAAVTNTGVVEATGYYGAYGIAAQSYLGDVTVGNGSSGNIHAAAPSYAYGVFASAYGNVTINNAGDISASADVDGTAAAVFMESQHGQSTFNNAATGSISIEGTDGYAFALIGSDAVDIVNNSGRINGALSLYAGNDVFNNAASGTWDVGSTLSTDFGDGDDVVNNAGLVRFNDGAISFGGADASNRFNNTGTVRAFGENLVSMGDGVFTNSNLLDFIDGHTDDALAIEGDFAGTGRMNIDLDLAGSADQLFIDGSVAANAVQTVNVLFEGMPTTAHTSVAFARVTGTSAAGNFVGGQMIGYNEPANFLDLDLNVTSQLNAANTAADVFYVNLDVVGLNDTGALAASVASGAAGFLNSQVGTFRQRLGANPYGDAGSVMSAFVRAYTDEGDVSPDHVAANFGQGGNFAYNQSTWGREIGVNANLFGNFHAGLVLGNADSRQRLTGAGHGENRMDGMTWGAYATWYVPEGFYVDLSGRWMAADVKSISAAGTLVTRAHTRAVSLEGGYEWKLGSFTLVPQLQYTRTEVQDVRTIYGDRADFMAHGGTYSRGRLGVELNKTFTTASGLRWTPYGSINAIREFDGESTYTVADNFHGSTSLDGTSAMAELGIGVQKGGFGFSLGANWTDGGALDGFVGGQAVFRFAW